MRRGGELAQCVLNQQFGFGVDAGGRFVEHQNLRVGRQHARECEQLPLTLRQVLAALREHRVVAVGQRADEPVGVDGARGVHRALARNRRVAERDVVVDRPGEDVEILQHHADAAAQVAGVDVVQVDAVEEDLAVGEIVETPQQPDERALAGAGRTDDREFLAGTDVERYVAQHRHVRVVAEVDVTELDFAAQPRRQRAGVAGS